MAAASRIYWLPGLLACAMLLPAAARAECGGSQECIAVSIDATPPFHGSPSVSAPLAFGSQPAGSTSAAREIRVGAVSGPAGTRATLQSITLRGANAADFRISSTTCTTGSPSLLHDGTDQTPPQNTCGLSVTFNPTAVGEKSAAIDVTTSAITRTVPLTGTATSSGTGPVATAAALATQVNTPATVDLAPFITGTATGIAIVTQPTHGSATASGTSVTYVPANNYFGPDSFTYAAFNNAGSSAAAPVSVTVGGRPDPSRDPNVMGLVSAQAQAARRFANAQISNFQQRLESLHAGAGADRVAGGPDGRVAGALAGRNAFVDSTFGARAPRTLPGTGGVWEPASGGLAGPGADAFGLRPVVAAGESGDIVPTRLVTAMLSAAMAGEGAGTAVSGNTGLWVGGNLNFGTRGSTADTRGLRFRTDGVTVGFDRRLNDKLVLGAGVGFARDRTDIGSDGTMSTSSGVSVAFYGSYRPSADTFVDALLGYGTLKHDGDRYVPAMNDYARFNDRKSHQFFGSVAGGYELRRGGVLLSPYGRVDLAVDRFEQVTETGAGAAALTYHDNTTTTVQVAAGLRAESRHQTSFGLAVPRLRAELRHAFQADREVTISFADQIGGLYTVTPPGTDRTSLLLGVGSDFLFRNGLTVGLDYQLQRSFGNDRSHAVRLYLRKDFDGKGPSGALASATLFEDPVRVEAGYMWDSNVNRAGERGERLTDHIYSLGVTKSTTIPISTHVRALLAGFLNGEKPYTYDGLDRFSAGLRGEVQYRTSGAFSAPTFALFTRALIDEYHSDLRSGYRYAYGASARQSWTDRIDVFAALTWNERHARSDVFDASEYGARFNIDYSLGRAGVVYIGGEYRRGDAVSTGGAASLGTGGIAKASTPDDAFGGTGLTAYRLEARTVIWSLGFNHPLGARDSIDFSWRRAESTPEAPAGGVGTYGGGGGLPRYKVNQFSIVYLVRF